MGGSPLASCVDQPKCTHIRQTFVYESLGDRGDLCQLCFSRDRRKLRKVLAEMRRVVADQRITSLPFPAMDEREQRLTPLRSIERLQAVGKGTVPRGIVLDPLDTIPSRFHPVGDDVKTRIAVRIDDRVRDMSWPI